MRPADTIMSLFLPPLKLILEEADDAKRQGDNFKAETLINIAYEMLDQQFSRSGDDHSSDFYSMS